MNRNTEQHFALTPSVAISRSKFDRSHDHKTSWNNGELIPIYVDTTIMPGDTVKMDMSEVVRMMTPIAPVMDDMVQDIYYFFVPYRLIWDHFKRFMGENDTAPWAQTTEYTIPQVENHPYAAAQDQTVLDHSIADYMGYPIVGKKYYSASALPFRAYCLIWNEFFRDENLQNPINIGANIDSNQSIVNYEHANYDEVTHAARGGGKPLKVCRLADYFSTCLPQAQKGNPVYVPLGTKAPVRWEESNVPDSKLGDTYAKINNLDDKVANLGFYSATNDDRTGAFGYNSGDENITTASGTENKWSLIGMYTDLSQAIGATVNQLRQAFAIQKYYERNAIGGTRYIEYVKAHYGVTNPDYRLQRPEYLGGKRIPINMNQVLQSTPTDGTTTPLGTTGAYSVTSDASHMFTHSFTEHGILMGLTCCRTVHTYQQGLNRQFSKKKIFDFYTPEFANLGNEAVMLKELYLQGTDDDETAFGYQEAWAAERYFPNIVTASMRSSYTGSLDIWHYADNYESAPSLGDTWIKEGKENVERTLAVQNEDQLFGDFYFKAIYTRPMPLYSIPGLIDHH